MATLDYRCNGDNGLSFELLVDGQPLGVLIGSRDTAIPYWIIEDDLPYIPPNATEHDPELRIVTVCSCGEYGCGHARCRVLRQRDEVIFREFALDVAVFAGAMELRFSRANYQDVVSQIVRRANEYRRSLSRDDRRKQD